MDKLDLHYIYTQLRYIEEKTRYDKTYPITIDLFDSDGRFNQRAFLKLYTLHGIFIIDKNRYEYTAIPSVVVFKDPDKISYKYPVGDVTFKVNGKNTIYFDLEALCDDLEEELNKEDNSDDKSN